MSSTLNIYGKVRKNFGEVHYGMHQFEKNTNRSANCSQIGTYIASANIRGTF